MKPLVLSAEDVRAFLPMPACIEAMSDVMKAVSAGEVSMPTRIIAPVVDRSGYLAVMPASLSEPRVFGAKVVSLLPGNPAKGRLAIQGYIILFDHDTGVVVALVDGAEVTALRTAAASGLATRWLARKDATTLGILGTGVQAGTHISAVRAVRPIKEVLVWGRSFETAQRLAEMQSTVQGLTVRAVKTADEASGCDVVCAVTGAVEPVVLGKAVRPGAHVNLVGAHQPDAREADTDLVSRARVYVDVLDAAFKEAGDILLPIKEGAVGKAHVLGEIGSVVAGSLAGRTADDEITLYKSLGIAAQDLAAAHVVLQRFNASR